MGRKPAQPKQPRETMKVLPLAKIDPPGHDVRIDIDEDKIQELVASIRAVGLIEPITVKPRDDRYEIIAGHRRYLAHQRLKKPVIKAIICDWPDNKIEAARLLENIDREPLSPWEEAVMIEAYKKRHKLNGIRLATILGKSQAWVSQRLAICKYPDVLKNALSDKKISFSVARELARIENPNTLNQYLYLAIENGITPALAARWANDANMMDTPDRGEAPPSEPPTTISEPGPPGQRCFVCGEFHPFNAIHPIWICDNDKKVVSEYSKQVQNPASQPDG